MVTKSGQVMGVFGLNFKHSGRSTSLAAAFTRLEYTLTTTTTGALTYPQVRPQHGTVKINIHFFWKTSSLKPPYAADLAASFFHHC